MCRYTDVQIRKCADSGKCAGMEILKNTNVQMTGIRYRTLHLHIYISAHYFLKSTMPLNWPEVMERLIFWRRLGSAVMRSSGDAWRKLPVLM